MRILISASEDKGLDSQVDHHFGRCPYFVLVDLEGDDIRQVETVNNPHATDHRPGMVPEYIHSLGVEVTISGGMGQRAIGRFETLGIKPTTGASGTVRSTLEAYLRGELEGVAPCRKSVEHDDHHHHGRGHNAD